MGKANQKIVLYWENVTAKTFRRGVDLEILAPDCVRYKETGTPPGTAIQTWHSRVTYDGYRFTPEIPPLENGIVYHLHLVADREEAELYSVRVVAFDRFHEEKEVFLLECGDGYFTLPEDTDCMEVQLINAGGEGLIFHRIEMERQENEGESESEAKVTLLPLEGMEEDVSDGMSEKRVTLLFPEPLLYDPAPLASQAWKKLAPGVAVQSSRKMAGYFLDKETRTLIAHQIERWMQEPPIHVIQLIGYGPVGNTAVSFYLHEVQSRQGSSDGLRSETKAVRGYVTPEVLDIGEVKKRIAQMGEDPSFLRETCFAATPHVYGKTSDVLNVSPFALGLVDRREQWMEWFWKQREEEEGMK